MIALVISSAIFLVVSQASVNAPRSAFSACLKEAGAKAVSDKVALDAYGAYIRGACATQAMALKKALVAFDTKNGVKRAQASTDAEAQLDDYYLGSSETYSLKVAATQPAKPPAPQPAATPAAQTVPASSPK